MIEAIEELFQRLTRYLPALEVLRRFGGQTLNNGGGLVTEDIDLAALLAAPSGKQTVPRGGRALYYSPRGSARGGLLQLELGGQLKDFGPGDRITGTFDEFVVQRHPDSAELGIARLVITTSPWAELEAMLADPSQAAGTDLLGTFNTPTPAFIAVAEDTDPSGTAPAGSFDCSGWNTIRLLIDTQTGGANATTFDLIPWALTNKNVTNVQAIWFEQGTERISVPDTDTTGGRYRVVIFNVKGRARMYFSIRNLQAAARTGLGFIVQGIN